MGLVAPEPGFLEGLRAACDKAGALLVFDEVITGFRFGRSGASGRLGVTPDLWCFGKVLGGGMPLAAFAGSRDLMANLAPLGPVYQAGTLSGNPVATAAGRAVLDLLDEAAYEQLESTATHLAKSLGDALGDGFHVPRCGPLVGIFCRDETVKNYEDAKDAAATESVSRAIPRHARPRRGARPGRVRDHVPRPRPRPDRDRADGRSRRRRGQRSLRRAPQPISSSTVRPSSASTSWSSSCEACSASLTMFVR